MRKLILLASAAAGVLATPHLAAAQDKTESTGLAEIVVTATKTLDATVSGSGAIFYGGDPSQVTTSVTGSGVVMRG